jgi:hypothetical protein
MFAEAVQVLPLSVEYEICAFTGAHNTRLASAAAATVPPFEDTPEMSLLPANQLEPPS